MAMTTTALHLRGIVLPEGRPRDVFVADGKITFSPVEGARTLLDRGYLVPGLFDAHAHLELNSPAPDDASPEERIRASAVAQLDAGVLALREPGGPSRASNGIGPHIGLPRTFTAGRMLAPPGRYVPGLAREVTEAGLPAAAEEEARASRSWVKIIGDFPAPHSIRLEAHYGRRALADAAERVHRVGARIAIHAQLPEVIEAAVEAGFDSIEHGTLINPDVFPAMAKQGTAFTPTIIIREGMLQMLAAMGAPPDELDRMIAGLDRLPEMVRGAAAAGVCVLAGTDAGLTPHGVIRREVEALLGGLTPEQALGAASWDARSFFGLPCIDEGVPADIVAYADDPRANPEVLRKPLLRILDGHAVG